MKRTTYTPDQLEDMKKLYLTGLSVQNVADKLETDKGTCRKALIGLGVLRTKQESSRIARGISYVKSDAFDILTLEALYWIGFMYADGFIESKVPVIGLGLANADRAHVEKFNQFLGGKLNIATINIVSKSLKGIINTNSVCARLKVADTQLYNRLLSLGFTGNKTHVIKPHELLKYSRDFWRGVVDGDGWLSTVNCDYTSSIKTTHYEYSKIGLCGNEATITEFLKFIELSGIDCRSCVKKAKRETGLYSMDSTGKSAISIMHLLYKDSTIYLERKYQKYLELTKE